MMLRHIPLVTASFFNATVTAAALSLALVPAADAQRPDEGFDKDNHRVTKEWTGAEEAFPGRQGTPKSAILIHADGSQGDVIHYVDYDGEAIFGGDILIDTGDASTREIDFLSGAETRATALAIFY